MSLNESNNSTKPCFVTLTESTFGVVPSNRTNHEMETVLKYTWKNQNNVIIQVLTYGARIHSIKFPDSKGKSEDIVLGFDDIAGYWFYSDHYFNSVIGRVTNKVENGTYVLDNKQYHISANNGSHHSNGGFDGLDKVNFRSYINGQKVIMSHVIPDLHEGFLGEVLVVITLELNVRNEFKVDMEAYTTKPTIINLSNLVYFNLAGHNKGSSGLYHHVLQVNANCFTLYKEEDLPTGKIMNVVHSKFDFQVPTRLGKVLGKELDDGYDQNLCVNRGVDQGNCFVARMTHPPTGRVLEIYSNQPGLNFYTGNKLGSGKVNIPVSAVSSIVSSEKGGGSLIKHDIFDLVERLHARLAHTISITDNEDYRGLRSLIGKLLKCEKYGSNATTIDENIFEPNNTPIDMGSPDFHIDCVIKPIELQYLMQLKDAAEDTASCNEFNGVRIIIEKILTNNYMDEEHEVEGQVVTEEKPVESEEPVQTVEPAEKVEPVEPAKPEESVEPAKPEESVVPPGSSGSKTSKQSKESILKTDGDRVSQTDKKSYTTKSTKSSSMKNQCGMCDRDLQKYYRDGRIHGKYGAIYERHGAFCLQTQNYPNAIYHSNFPKCVLKPGEKYTHSIVYKFWLQPGNANKYVRRVNREAKQGN